MHWANGTANTDTVVDSNRYAYDRDGSVTAQNNVFNANPNSGSTPFNENYTYDGLFPLGKVSRGRS